MHAPLMHWLLQAGSHDCAVQLAQQAAVAVFC